MMKKKALRFEILSHAEFSFMILFYIFTVYARIII